MTPSRIATGILDSGTTALLRAELALRGVLHDFAAVTPAADPTTVDWARALALASALTGQDDARAQDVALRIAQGCLVADDALEHHREAAAIVLERLGNRPSLQLAVERQRIDAESWTRAPAPLQLDVVRRRLELAIPIAGGDIVAGNPSSGASGPL